MNWNGAFRQVAEGLAPEPRDGTERMNEIKINAAQRQYQPRSVEPIHSVRKLVFGPASFDEQLPYQPDGRVVDCHGVDGSGGLGFDSGEGAWEMATTSTEGSRRANCPMPKNGWGSKKK